MCLQEKTIHDYFKFFENPTLKQISIDTGINLTRIFRIIHGSPMKLFEFEIFNEKIKVKKRLEGNFSQLISDSEESLGISDFLLVKTILNRKLKGKKLKHIYTDERIEA